MSRRHDDVGAVAVFTAIVATVLLMVAALAVDLGNAWARRGQLQVQADRAATYAAQFLPADDDAERAEVAKAVAYYISCHVVQGQRELDPTIPACPDDSHSSTLTLYATRLLATGMVTFPVRNQVQVTTPRAMVDFAFGGAVGADGTIQQKVAAAKVTSPGMLSPMALSLDCMLNAGANVLGGGGLPVGYISTTHKGGGGTATATAWYGPTQDNPRNLGATADSAQQSLLGAGPTIRVSGSNWPTLGLGQAFSVVFALGDGLFRQEHAVLGTLVLDSGRNPRRNGYVSVQVPALVMQRADTWHVKVAVLSALLLKTYSVSETTFTVVPAVTAPPVSCGRLLKSPRAGNQANANFPLNLQEGIDHLITTYPQLLGTGGLTREDLLEIAALTQCSGSSSDTVVDTNGQSGTPNCVVTKMSNAYEAGFTDGLIGPNGRLTCTTRRPCRPGKSFQLAGRSVNNDLFSDFVKNTSLLTSSTFFNLDAFLTTGLPVVTPTSNLDRAIYNSHRFMWVAVISTLGATSAVEAGDYPVLTFRPIFVTQETALDTLPLLDSALLPLGLSIPVVLDLVDATMRTLLAPGLTDQQGLLMDSSGGVSAIRFMTISPDALPAVPADYAGPESEYLGVGPRIIRLVQ